MWYEFFAQTETHIKTKVTMQARIKVLAEREFHSQV
jgi:hypothetical protein